MTSSQVPSVETERHEALQRAEAEVRAMAARLRSARQRLALHDTVDRILAEASSPEQALPRILRSLGRTVHWDVAGYWQVDEDAGLLRRGAVWHAEGGPEPDPEQDAKSLRQGPTLKRGEGLPGRAWSGRLPTWSQDGAQDGSFDHLSWADRGHLHGAFAVPVLLGDRVLGVVELMSRELRHRENGLLELVTALGRQLAQFLDRSRAEAALSEAEGRFAAFMDGSPAVAWIKDEDSRYVHVNRSLERLLQRDLEAVKGKADAELWPEETAGRLLEADKAVLTAGSPITTTESLATGGGMPRDWTIVRFPFRDPSKRRYIGGLAIDVTPQTGDQEGQDGEKDRLIVLEEQDRSRAGFERMIGKSEKMQDCYRRLRLAAQSDVTVVLSGESGAGKELAAAAIHALSSRRDKPFLAVSCSALPETLLESELFGHVKGSFTGAIRDKVGLFQAADGGTLLLDEVGDMSPLLQLKLLRVLQEREVHRVGDERAQEVDVRLITASNRDLRQLLVTGELREDFYYRIRVFEIGLPPLRERGQDIPLLVARFIAEFAPIRQPSVKGIAADALQRLMEYAWPGNVRELRNAIESALVTATGDRIRLRDLPTELRSTRPGAPTKAAGRAVADAVESDRIKQALAATGGRRAEAAKTLGMSRVTLWKKMKRLGLDDTPD